MRMERQVREWPKRGRFGGPSVEIEFGVQPLQRADVFRPPLTSQGAKSPVVLFLHGGAWRTGSRKRHRFVGGALARRGFLCVTPDYRKYPACGYGGSLADAAAALGWIVKHADGLHADASCVFLAGHSAGAFMATALSLSPSVLQRHGIDHDRIRGVIGLAGLYADPRRYVGLRPVFEEESEPVSPIALAGANAGADPPPVLLFHGERDRFVAFDECSRFASTLAGVGGRAVVRALPKGGHAAPLFAMSAFLKRTAPCLDDTVAFMRAEADAHRS